MFIKNRQVFIAFAAFFCANLGGVMIFTHNSPAQLYVYTNRPFYMVNEIGLALASAAGLASLFGLAGKRMIPAALAAAVLPASCLVLNWKQADLSRSFLSYDMAMNIMGTPPEGAAVFAKSDDTVFNVHYMKYIKNKRPDVDFYDEMANVLDTSWVKGIRTRKGLDGRELTQRQLDIISRRNGNVFFVDGIGFPDQGLEAEPYGMLLMLGRSRQEAAAASGIMKMYSYRDIFTQKYPDYSARNIMASYFVRKLRFAAIRRDSADFNRNREAAERMAFDSSNVLLGIAYVFFRELNDIKSCMVYLEKCMEINPYDFTALNLIISLYKGMGMEDMASGWIRYYAEKEWEPVKKAALLAEARKGFNNKP